MSHESEISLAISSPCFLGGTRKERVDHSVALSEANFPKFKSPSTLPVHMEHESSSDEDEGNLHRHKSNSTSSLYIQDTLESPNVDALVRCMAVALEYHIQNGLESQNHDDSSSIKSLEIFDEQKHPLTTEPVNTSSPPSINQIYNFLSAIFHAERVQYELGAQCGILCLAYIERIMSITKMSLTPTNWRRVALSALILASKVWEDQAVWNIDFLSIFDCVTAHDLAQLEKVILNLLQFNVSLKAALYAKYYFELRSLAEEASMYFPLDPLSKEDAEKLEKRSAQTEENEKKKHKHKKKKEKRLRRSSSDTSKNLNKHRSPRVVLN